MPPGAGDGSRFDTGRQDVTIKPIPQWVDGIQYRSSLEARWAIFFREARIRAEYEPEGFVVGGKPYRPDFLLPDCGTWVEVKGDPGRLDIDLMVRAAVELPRPQPKYESGPPVLILGHIPPVTGHQEGSPPDWGWIGLHAELPEGGQSGDEEVVAGYYGFGCYHKNLRPWWLEWAHPVATGIMASIGKIAEFVLEPVLNEFEPGIPSAYAAARAHRFGR
jgi:hypothetical protein